MTTQPQRIQRKRAKGWKKPPNTVCVTRPGKWGNPFNWVDCVSVGFSESDAKKVSLEMYENWILGRGQFATHPYGKPPTIQEIKTELKGKNIACFCKVGQPCHGDWLLKIANEDPANPIHSP